MCHIMKTTTIRELKHATSTVLSWVEQGETVEIRRRNHPVAILTPPTKKEAVVLPDFAGRLQAIYGDHLMPVTADELISEARGES